MCAEEDIALIVAAGGDGTLNEVISGMHAAGLRLPVGYIPVGSTNDFAASLELPGDPVKAAELIEDGRLDRFVEQKYSSWNSGLGKKIRNNETTLEELFRYAEEMGAPELPGSGRQEYLEGIVNNVLFK